MRFGMRWFWSYRKGLELQDVETAKEPLRATRVKFEEFVQWFVARKVEIRLGMHSAPKA